jgi:PD-(D/E)XK nuclease superfamily protein
VVLGKQVSNTGGGTIPTSDNDGVLVALNELVSDVDGTGDLERLEDAFSEFNLFEAIGATRSELRHSSFLAWLFDPSGSHGLGDLIVKRLLQRVLIQELPHAPLTPVDLDLLDLGDLEVRREWANIDVLLLSPLNKLVVVIENKIGATEGTTQLGRYRARIADEFPLETGWRHIFVFLTLEGTPPTDEAYVSLSHRVVVELLESAMRNRRSGMTPEVLMAVRHYAQMMRRHHMEDSELIALARRIYARHKAALDFIFDNRPDGWTETRQELLNLISKNPSLVVDPSTSRTIFIRLYPAAWTAWSNLLSRGTGWKFGGSDRLVLCEIKPDKERLQARMEIVLGPSEGDERQRIIAALREADAYKGAHGTKWTTIFKTPWRQLESEGEIDPHKNAKRLFNDVEDFLRDQCPTIETALSMAFGREQESRLAWKDGHVEIAAPQEEIGGQETAI